MPCSPSSNWSTEHRSSPSRPSSPSSSLSFPSPACAAAPPDWLDVRGSAQHVVRRLWLTKKIRPDRRSARCSQPGGKSARGPPYSKMAGCVCQSRGPPPTTPAVPATKRLIKS
eukprot:917099-Prymnesium_polylepis.1